MRSNLTFIRFDAIVASSHHLSTLDGVYTIENPGWMPNSLYASGEPPTPEAAFMHEPARAQVNALLLERHATNSRQVTFSDTGKEMEVTLRDDHEISAGEFLWFPRRYAVFYISKLSSLLESSEFRRCVLSARSLV
jgi:hypothetical protein